MKNYNVDVSEIVLTVNDKKLLRKLLKDKVTLISEEDFRGCEDYDYLLDKNLAKINQGKMEDDGMIEILPTSDAERYFTYQRSVTVETVRNWITTVIAVAAFVLSVISIVLQYI